MPSATTDAGRFAFPPELVPLARARFQGAACAAMQWPDDLLVRLLATIFFASLQTHEGRLHPIRVVVPARVAARSSSSLLAFAGPRPFDPAELAKLATIETADPLFTAVRSDARGGLEIFGLERAGPGAPPDDALRVVAGKPGHLSLRAGGDGFLEYQMGRVQPAAQSLLATAGPVREALESAARCSSFEHSAWARYLDTLRRVLSRMSGHGHGGLLVLDAAERVRALSSQPYGLVPGASLASLIRLSTHIGGPGDAPTALTGTAFRDVMLSAFTSEIERLIDEIGALTAIDGASVLDFGLELAAFGVILPVEQAVVVEAARDPAGSVHDPLDLGLRGTRHRAGATYAARHPGSVVFVASADGPLSCVYRAPAWPSAMLWQLAPGDTA